MNETLVQFAGDDRKPRQRPVQEPSAHSLFLKGYNTGEIAAIRGEPEHSVLRQITIDRSHLKGQKAEFEPSRYRESRTKAWLDRGNPHLGGLS